MKLTFVLFLFAALMLWHTARAEDWRLMGSQQAEVGVPAKHYVDFDSIKKGSATDVLEYDRKEVYEKPRLIRDLKGYMSNQETYVAHAATRMRTRVRCQRNAYLMLNRVKLDKENRPITTHCTELMVAYPDKDYTSAPPDSAMAKEIGEVCGQAR